MRPGRTIDQLAESFEPLPQDYSPENYAAAHADWKELVARAKAAEARVAELERERDEARAGWVQHDTEAYHASALRSAKRAEAAERALGEEVQTAVELDQRVAELEAALRSLVKATEPGSHKKKARSDGDCVWCVARRALAGGPEEQQARAERGDAL